MLMYNRSRSSKHVLNLYYSPGFIWRLLSSDSSKVTRTALSWAW
jgi:hypothetical protein